MTAHWIDVDPKGGWTLRSEVIGFRGLSGAHTGDNLGRYVIGLCERVGIIEPGKSRFYTLTLDNTSSNTTLCSTIENIHYRRQLESWNAKENQLP